MRLLLLCLWGLSCLAGARAQQQPQDNTSTSSSNSTSTPKSTSASASMLVPPCAQKCLVSAFGSNTCRPTDQKCICTNAIFQANVTGCVTVSCTVPESLMMRNISLTNCGAPVRDRGQSYITLSNIMASIAASFVAVRFGYKIFLTSMDIGYDDWAVLATLVVIVPSAIITVYGTVANGMGRDIWTLTPEQITSMLQHFYFMASLYFAQVTLLKLTLLFFYIRVFPSPPVQRLLWGTVIFVTAWGFAYILVAIFQCNPINYFWHKWDGMHHGTCLDINAITESNAGISIALDFWILGIPLWQLWGLKMHWKKKVGVALMFCVGTFVTVVSILRIRALMSFASSTNASWEFFDVSIWSTIEICVGIMCACLPTLRLLLVRLFPALAGTSVRSRNKYYNYGSGNELKDISHSHSRNKSQGLGPTASATVRSPPRDVPFDRPDGILVKTSYVVRHGYNETDEASLVSHDAANRNGMGPGERI